MNKHFLNVLFLSVSLFITTGLFATQQIVKNEEKPITLFVEFEFDAKDKTIAMELLTEMQNQSLDNEEGCIMYDILLSEEHPNNIFIYECYENQAALNKHNAAAYFKTQKILTLHSMNDVGTVAF